jgi:O-methyltransferase
VPVGLDRIREYTMTSPECIEVMKSALKEIDDKGIEGDIVECGVWKGGNIILARALSPHRVCWAYDTFTGMTAPDDVDGAWAKQKFDIRSQPGHKSRKSHIDGKWLAIPVDDVKQNIRAFDLYDETKLRFVRGPVEKTLLDAKNIPDKISLLRLDTDWHASTKVELEVLYPRLSPGGVLIIDDYGHWQGSRIATDEYFAESPLPLEYIDEKKFSVFTRKPC